MKPLTYSRYLRVEDLLRLQERLTAAHDELQFITIHQVFELWFKLLLFELESIRGALDRGEIADAVHWLRRTHEIVKTLAGAWAVIETMRPIDFLAFRSELKPASGFQSRQFREIEFLSGLKDPRYLNAFAGDEASLAALRARLAAPSLWDAFVDLLRARGLPAADNREIRDTLIRINRRGELAEIDDLAEALIEYDLLFSGGANATS
jgi:tryptophan 2,3-dioxygenase